ncbi:MAG: hypothetical protein IPJ41_03980 [Phycisphaerales bacterium]|nr:hypothetical protein [Phycisphaerales bacterium]
MLAAWRRTTPARVVTRIALITMVLLPAGAGFAVWISDPGVRSSVSSNRYDYRLDELHWQLASMFWDRIEADPAWAACLDPDSAEQVCRELLSSAWRDTFEQPSGEWRNGLLGTAMREAREPGAYRIWQEDGAVWFATCDIAGQETATRIWTQPRDQPEGD